MKSYSRPFFFSLLMALFVFSACDRTTIPAEPSIEPPLEALRLDGSVSTAPRLEGGTYEAAVRFEPADLAAMEGKPLTDVYYFFFEKPASSSLKIYQGSFNGGPDELVYSAATSSETSPNSWNHHVLSNEVLVDATRDLWVAVKFSMSNQSQIIACDPGPADPNGDWLYDAADDDFINFITRTGGEANINWNIRAVVNTQ